jgi:hypothetical protein
VTCNKAIGHSRWLRESTGVSVAEKRSPTSTDRRAPAGLYDTSRVGLEAREVLRLNLFGHLDADFLQLVHVLGRVERLDMPRL